MNSTKVLIPDKEWIVQSKNQKVGSVAKVKKGYLFLKNGKTVPFKNLAEIHNQLGIEVFEKNIKKNKIENPENENSIYDYPCSSKPYDPVFNIKKKLPLFAKSEKSKSQYCAGYYIIKFRKGWVKSFCPKLITLERYPYYGPYKTELEMKTALNTVNKP